MKKANSFQASRRARPDRDPGRRQPAGLQSRLGRASARPNGMGRDSFFHPREKDMEMTHQNRPRNNFKRFRVLFLVKRNKGPFKACFDE